LAGNSLPRLFSYPDRASAPHFSSHPLPLLSHCFAERPNPLIFRHRSNRSLLSVCHPSLLSPKIMYNGFINKGENGSHESVQLKNPEKKEGFTLWQAL